MFAIIFNFILNMDQEDFKSNKQLRGKRLKIIREMSGLTRQALTDKYGISYGNFQNWEDARYGGLTEEGAKTMLRAYKAEGIEATLEWLMFGIGPGPKITEKFYTKNKSQLVDIDITAAADTETAKIIRELLFFQQNHGQILAMTIKDNSMEPYYHIGEYVVGKVFTDKNIALLVDYDCIVEVGSSLILRKLKFGSDAYSFNLVAYNSKSIMSDVRVTRAAPVTWIRRKTCGF